MESRNSYGWGMVGSTKKGFEWRLVYGDMPHERIGSGYVYKTEAAAIRADRKFQRESTYEPYRKGTVTAIPAEPLHFEY